jgi:hypothetical protein
MTPLLARIAFFASLLRFKSQLVGTFPANVGKLARRMFARVAGLAAKRLKIHITPNRSVLRHLKSILRDERDKARRRRSADRGNVESFVPAGMRSGPPARKIRHFS